jgi:hypothetical protein
MAEKMSIDNKPKDESDESVGSTPEGDTTMPAPGAGHDGQQPKRKGGRKPIYATSEERKQRNRQAQAAFRERRTEYIKQLEETIRVHESNLHSLQAAHRNAADECLMLRYKNSLLERILLEKGKPNSTGPAFAQLSLLTDHLQALMFRLSFVPRLAVPTLDQRTCLRTWSSHRPFSVPS